jgi:hypothetical protein
MKHSVDLKSLVWSLIAGFLLASSACEKVMPPAEGEVVKSPHIAAMSSLRASLTAVDWGGYQTKWVQFSPAQKYEVWVEKLAETRDLPQWNAAQRAKIASLADGLSPATFDRSFSDGEEL